MLICMRGRRRSALLVHSRREEAGTSPVQALAAQSWPYQEAGVRSLGGQRRPDSERAAWLLAARLNTAPDCNPYHRCRVIRAHIQCSEVCHLRCCEMAQYNHLFFSAVIVCSVPCICMSRCLLILCLVSEVLVVTRHLRVCLYELLGRIC